MRPDNETCVQRARFFFYFFEKASWGPGENPPLKDIVKAPKVEPQAVRNLNKFLNERLERIARMMDLLLDAHDDWAIAGKKDCILMETESYDFNDAVAILKNEGFFGNSDFILKVEYTRKWGVL